MAKKKTIRQRLDALYAERDDVFNRINELRAECKHPEKSVIVTKEEDGYEERACQECEFRWRAAREVEN